MLIPQQTKFYVAIEQFWCKMLAYINIGSEFNLRIKLRVQQYWISVKKPIASILSQILIMNPHSTICSLKLNVNIP